MTKLNTITITTIKSAVAGNRAFMDTIPDDLAVAAGDRAVARIQQRADALLAGTIDAQGFLNTCKSQSAILTKAYGDCKNTIVTGTILLVITNIAGMMVMLNKEIESASAEEIASAE